MSYPKLSQEGEKVFQNLIDRFKLDMKKASENVLGELYIDCSEHIEHDAWINFRGHFIDAFRRLDTNFCGEYNLLTMARTIGESHPETLAGFINQDNVKRIEQLEKIISDMKRWR